MRILIQFIIVLILTGLPACSENTSTSSAKQTQSRVSDNNVFSDQVKALEKAEKVEGQIMDAFNKRNAAIENNQ